MLKRSFDILASFLGLILFCPIILIVAWLVKRNLGAPVLFRQVRPGLNGVPFEMIKFRTMRDAVDHNGEVLADGDRLTKFGRFLRSSSLDELPELWNVLRNDMSIVGPRPLLDRYTPYFTEEERCRFSVKPGITGWAQINGRNECKWDARLAYDVWYVKNRSFLLDMRIIFLTFYKVLKSDGIVVDPSQTMLNLDEERSRKGGGDNV
ncbi:sugar transferase [Pseudomonas sp. URMO17WK12:I2]|uniref:sugar transferase n=1 Tax=Pseudomonas sp. URMO17WK12:I2 TaxID=1261623 RepID=UPI000DAC3064|nr:sugar transferase [Pseudomonas sp. URMO17WK12:I2]PZW43411.1 lipopolysaccharide/colanic/teichoic acid biosynthesis glycosyltransferase [Pseudomonas sp. URMO17WK12:I2]